MKSTEKYTFASLFSGCGGFDLGFIQEGFSPRAAYDIDESAVENYKKNISNDIHCVDLTGGLPNAKSLRGVDVLLAGPPCQGFSTAGKRKIDDERNHLLTLTGELALRIRPKVLVVENVFGALSGAHARYWTRLDEMMRGAGFYTKTVRCHATELGMSQIRKRALLFAWRTRDDGNFSVPSVPPMNLRQVLAGVSKAKNHHPCALLPNSRDWLIANQIGQGQKLSNVRGGENAVATWDIPEVFGFVTEHERTVLELLRRLRRQARTRDYGDADPVTFERLESALGKRFQFIVESLIHKGYVRRIGSAVDLVGTFNGKYRRLSWDKPSCTVDTRFGSPRYFLHPSQNRGFSVREAARIQGFPDEFVFSGSVDSQYRVIGNAVPPPLGAYAAKIAMRLLKASE